MRAAPEDVLELETPHGVARAHLHPVAAPAGALVLGHGAGGSVDAADLQAAARAAHAAGMAVALVEQPYRVAGRRSAAPAHQLDAAWTAVAAQLRDGPLAGVPLVTGGRSSGARVACRTARATGAVAVLCLAFPLRPPRRSPDAEPTSRQDELDGAGVPTLVVQGATDRFGMPRPAPGGEVVAVAGDHRLRADLPAVEAAVRGWLPRVLAQAGTGAASGSTSA
jgi:uncharacterized protein